MHQLDKTEHYQQDIIVFDLIEISSKMTDRDSGTQVEAENNKLRQCASSSHPKRVSLF